jgi:hypothetical protein
MQQTSLTLHRPGLRERFVFYQHRYCGNLFWKLFCSSLRILWPFEFRDCYSRNLETGQYEISASFDERIGDINAWTMSGDIFKRWPEFYSDIPAYNHIPGSVQDSAARNPVPPPPASTHSLAAISEEEHEEVRNTDLYPAPMFDVWGGDTQFLSLPKGINYLAANHYSADMTNLNSVIF